MVIERTDVERCRRPSRGLPSSVRRGRSFSLVIRLRSRFRPPEESLRALEPDRSRRGLSRAKEGREGAEDSPVDRDRSRERGESLCFSMMSLLAWEARLLDLLGLRGLSRECREERGPAEVGDRSRRSGSP